MDFQIGKRIKEIRDHKNMSQERFGTKIGLSGKTISAYENGKAIPPLYVLEKIEKTYNEYIFGIPKKKQLVMNDRIEKISKTLVELQELVSNTLSL